MARQDEALEDDPPPLNSASVAGLHDQAILRGLRHL